MAGYDDLAARLADRAVIILDGAVGTQLQSMAVPMNKQAWAAAALETHPFTVRRMHENYIAAGVDVITTNTYASARHNLVPLGLIDSVMELNLRAVMLAQDARDRCAKERPVYIAGSVSNFGLITEAESGTKEYWESYSIHRMELSEQQSRANLREQAEILAEGGVDFMIAEATGSTRQREWVIEACAATGLPVWAGFKCHLNDGDPVPRVGYSSGEPFAESFDAVAALGGSVVTLFHSSLASTKAALPIVKDRWQGPIAVYPEAERHDYVATYKDETGDQGVTPEEFLGFARDCVAEGVQIIGGCCGVELEHIRPLREALPTRLP